LAAESLNPVPLLAVVGPTASGKTALALAIAKMIDAEIVSADMGQMYRYLDAGTAKPEGRWDRESYSVAGIAHHLMDFLEPSEKFDAGKFADKAGNIITRRHKAGKRIILAGGTGLYIRALTEGLDDIPQADPKVRQRLLIRIRKEGGNALLHAELAQADPPAAESIPPGNTQRLIRALEVLELTGKRISELWGKRTQRPVWKIEYIGIDWGLDLLTERIRLRTESMLPNMIKEVKRIIPSQFSGDEPGFRCLGYPQAIDCAFNGLSLDEGAKIMTKKTRAYAKRQRTWFRNQTDVRWFPSELASDFSKLAEKYLKSSSLWNASS